MATIGNLLSIISFVDMDAFEAQLYIKKFYPHYLGTPCVVADKTGRILSVSYEAKAFGITRNIRLDGAKELCDSLQIIEKPDRWDKPDTHVTRHGSWAVFDALKEFCTKFGKEDVLEYHSSDGFFIDCTKTINDRARVWPYVKVSPNVFAEKSFAGNRTKILKKEVDYEIFRLLCGAAYVSEMSGYLFEKTGINCSAGISNNKLVAKMACPLHKPAGITVIPLFAFNSVAARIDLSEISGFGKEYGELVKDVLRVENLEQLQKFNLRDLEDQFGLDDGRKLYEGSRGLCEEKVIPKNLNKAVSCGKLYHNGPNWNMDTRALLWNLKNRTGEMQERLVEEMIRHNRVTASLQIQIEFAGDDDLVKTRRQTFGISPEPNHISHEQTSEQILQIIQNFEGISFNPTVKILKITLTASKWTEVEPNGPVSALGNLGLGSVVESESETEELGSSSLSCATEVQSNLGTPETQILPTTVVFEEKKEGKGGENLSRKVYQLRISLDQIEPKIWRVIQVPEDFTFYELHQTILDAFGLVCRLHYEFCTGLTAPRGDSIVVGYPIPTKYIKGAKFIYDEKLTPMKRYLGNIGDKVIYLHEYEYKVEWRHTVAVEKILPAVRWRIYPYFIDARGVAPPKDIFYRFLEIQRQLRNTMQSGFT